MFYLPKQSNLINLRLSLIVRDEKRWNETKKKEYKIKWFGIDEKEYKRDKTFELKWLSK